MKVALLDYGAGNVPSVERALEKLGARPFRATAPAELAGARAILLPGVGHFAALIRSLDAGGLRQPLLEALGRGTPFLGICLGLQALYAASEEAPALAGLGVFPAAVRALPRTVKLPHMGWNQLSRKQPSRLLEGIPPEGYFYFAHSFAAPCGADETVAVSSHGREFTAVVEHRNIFGVQFHPEKSGAAGAQVLGNFLGLLR